MNIPGQITAGDSAIWDDTDIVFAGKRYTSAGASLKYCLRGPSALDLPATANGLGWTTSLAAATSSTLQAGQYTWVAVLTLSIAGRATVASGTLTVLPDLTAQAAGYDKRTQAEKALADAKAALANLTSSGQKRKKYTVGIRSAEYYTAKELLDAISYWTSIVANERAQESIRNGFGDPRNALVRFE